MSAARAGSAQPPPLTAVSERRADRSRAALLAAVQDDLARAGGFPSDAWRSAKVCSATFALPVWFCEVIPLIYAHMSPELGAAWLLAVCSAAPFHSTGQSAYRIVSALRVDRLRLMQQMFARSPAQAGTHSLIAQSIELLDRLRAVIVPIDAAAVTDIDVALIGNVAFRLVRTASDAGVEGTARVARAAYAIAGGLFNISARAELAATVAAMADGEGMDKAWQSEANGVLTALRV